MNFHAQALLAFLAFHVIVTGGGLLFDQVAQALGKAKTTTTASWWARCFGRCGV
jgi:hypothetical protein